MRPAAPRRFLIGALRLVFFVDGNRDPPAPELDRHRHRRMRRLRKRWMIIVRRYSFRLSHIGHVDNSKAAVPAARPHFIAEAERVVQSMPLARPAWFFTGG